MTQYQPFVYSSPNIPTINPLGVVGTSYTSPSYTSGSEMINNLSNAILNRKKEEKKKKSDDALNQKISEEQSSKEVTKENVEEEPKKETQVTNKKTTDKNVEGINLLAENEKVVDDFKEGDID